LYPTESTPGDRVVRPHVNLVAVVLPIVLIGMGLLFGVISALLSPWYLGSPGLTTGTIVSSPTHHAAIEYTVDGATHTLQTQDNNPNWTLGQSVDIAYNPRNPAQASTTTDRVMGLVYGGVAAVCLLAGLVWGAFSLRRWQRERAVIRSGQSVEAAITAVTQQASVHQGNKIMTRVTCVWTTPDRVEHTARSQGRFMPRGTTLADLPVTTMTVYYDPDDPAKYYVDDEVLGGR